MQPTSLRIAGWPDFLYVSIPGRFLCAADRDIADDDESAAADDSEADEHSQDADSEAEDQQADILVFDTDSEDEHGPLSAAEEIEIEDVNPGQSDATSNNGYNTDASVKPPILPFN